MFSTSLSSFQLRLALSKLNRNFPTSESEVQTFQQPVTSYYNFGILIQHFVRDLKMNQNTKFEIKSNRLVRIQSMTLRRISNRILKDKVTSKVSYESKVSSLFFWLLILLAWPCSLALKKLKFRKSKFKTLKFSNQTKNGVCVTKWTFNC